MGLAFARRSFRNGTTRAKRLSKTVWPALAVSEMVLAGTGISPKFDQPYCEVAMSASGHKRAFCSVGLMSASPPGKRRSVGACKTWAPQILLLRPAAIGPMESARYQGYERRGASRTF